MTEAGTLRGAALLQRGAEDLVAVARGMTGTGPAANCSLGTGFQIASVTKQFTAAAVLLLADRDVLSVDDPVGQWLDGCRRRGTRSPCITCSAIPPAWCTGRDCPGWT